jgi:ethanolamine-phosphate cytidylyltransferase
MAITDIMTAEYLEFIFSTYQVDYVVHGDDPCIVNGKDVYAAAKRRGRYRSIPRTEGVSTTDIVGRMLLMTKDHHFLRKRGNSVGSVVSVSGMSHGEENHHHGDDSDSDNEILNEDSGYYGGGYGTPLGHQSKFLTTTNLLRLFSAGVTPAEDGMKVVYVDGAWDMFHCGHVEFLKEASKVSTLLSPWLMRTCELTICLLCSARRLLNCWNPWRCDSEQTQRRKFATNESSRTSTERPRLQIRK